jgi:cytochrome P450
VTDRPEVDFDHHDRAFHEGRHEAWAELRACPVAFNPRYGGFWVVSGYDEVAAVSRDSETFSSRYTTTPDGDLDYLGIVGIPRAGHVPPAGIAEADDDVHVALRRVLNPYMTPAAVAALRPRMARTATWFLDQHIADGAMDLVLDFANPVPAILTMELIGLPADGWEHYAELFHASIAYRRDSPELARATANIPAMLAELRAEVDDRRRAPRPDLLTALVQLRLDDGRALGDDELTSVLWNLVGGGLDTTTSLTSLSLHHLDAHPELRRQLIDHPELLPTATEELLRFFSVNETLTRTVTRDVELGGQQLRRGEHLMLSWLSANRDEGTFADADRVVLDRAPNPHLAFGLGSHRCIGMHLARTLFQVLFTEVLTRIPDYAVDHAGTQFYAGNPELNGLVKMPITFTPGTPVGPPERPY